jgi:hypothetical protein
MSITTPMSSHMPRQTLTAPSTFPILVQPEAFCALLDTLVTVDDELMIAAQERQAFAQAIDDRCAENELFMMLVNGDHPASTSKNRDDAYVLVTLAAEWLPAELPRCLLMFSELSQAIATHREWIGATYARAIEAFRCALIANRFSPWNAFDAFRLALIPFAQHIDQPTWADDLTRKEIERLFGDIADAQSAARIAA